MSLVVYDPEGNLLTAKNAQGTVSYVHDELNQVKQIIYPLSEIVEYVYDPTGNIGQIIYPDGSIVEYTYDEMNRLTDIIQDGEV